MTKKQVNYRRWYLAHREEQIARSALYNRTHKEVVAKKNRNLASRNREFINKLKDRPCMDCGVKYPSVCMEFDHRTPRFKYQAVGNLASSHWSIKRIQQEIAKCDLVCSNCHRIRTYSKKQYLSNPKGFQRAY